MRPRCSRSKRRPRPRAWRWRAPTPGELAPPARLDRALAGGYPAGPNLVRIRARHEHLRTNRPPGASRVQADALALDRAPMPLRTDLFGLCGRGPDRARSLARLLAGRQG